MVEEMCLEVSLIWQKKIIENRDKLKLPDIQYSLIVFVKGR